MSQLISLQGSLYSAIRNATTGKPGKMTWLGNASAASLAIAVEKSDKNESFSGSRGLYGSLITAKSGTLSITLDEFLVENLAMALHSTPVDIVSGTVSGEALPSGLVSGDEVQLDKRFTSNLVLTDSNATPATLVEGSDYEIVSAAGGIIKILDPTSLTQPFEADYSYAAADSLAIFANATPPERWIFFDGINTVTDEKVILDLFRVQFDPVSDFGLINEDWGGLQLTGTLLLDPINLKNSNLGGYGRMMKSAAA
ncbi:hypothetical protein [Azotobacter chroococcum]|uniref:Uncharacterized protein n=1 Tax=Azotobacter chroococcum TaxID=353 RepID=A0AAP9YFN5_9GAMM|nr:hypothetical protein [Azotobacter chroococcum]QQE90271.1 hypothetical protein GKQ51_08255 [Azotobacter chroococcum]